MKFFNIIDSAQGFYKPLEKLEKELSLEFILMDGMTNIISESYINDYLASNEEAYKDKRPVIICINSLLNGVPVNKNNITDIPKFSLRYEDFNQNLKLNSLGFHCEYRSTGGFSELKSISDHTFGYVNDDYSKYKAPIIFMSYDLSNTNNNSYAKRVFTYLVSQGLRKHITNYNGISWDSKEFPDDVLKISKSALDRVNRSTVSRLKELDSSIADMTNRLLDLSREQMSLKRSLEGGATDEQLKSLMDSINKTSTVAWCDFTNNGDTFRFLLKDLKIDVVSKNKDYAGTYDIGNVMVYTNFSNGSVRIENVDGNFVDGNKSHPHDMGGGNLCLGEIKSLIPELISDFRLVDLVDIMTSFLRSVNLNDSAGRTIVHYKKIK